ncbi:hypothetical protein A9306_08455 [Moraxella atlantae]|uniref:Uncharacterized protein n=1 Tax=Faucicola atlantae TaxID=34059 RepID=A0A1B8QDA0_9GAMM|nr:hypothetical protein A9306_08455 [Moraxella atlantae]
MLSGLVCVDFNYFDLNFASCFLSLSLLRFCRRNTKQTTVCITFSQRLLIVKHDKIGLILPKLVL